MNIKVVNIILSVILVGSVGINTYQYKKNSDIKNQLAELSSQATTIQSDIDSINNAIAEKKSELSNLQDKLNTMDAELVSTQDMVKNKQDELTAKLEETPSTPSTESSSTYQGGYTPEELDKMAEDIMKEIARDNGWTDSSESSETPPTTYTRSDGVTVTVTPSSGEGPTESTFGQGGEMPDYLKGDHILP